MPHKALRPHTILILCQRAVNAATCVILSAASQRRHACHLAVNLFFVAVELILIYNFRHVAQIRFAALV